MIKGKMPISKKKFKKNHYKSPKNHYPSRFSPSHFWKNIYASETYNNGWNKLPHGQVLGKEPLNWSAANTPHTCLDLSTAERSARMFEFHSSATSLFSPLNLSPASVSL